jgi:hypothetical protein
LKEDAATKGSGHVDYDSIEPWTRVSPQDYERNIREMIRLARERGAGVILLDNELWAGSPYRPILKTIAADAQVPLIDSLEVVAAARSRMEHDIAARLGLSPADPSRPDPSAEGGESAPPDASGPPPLSAYPGPGAMSIVGTNPQLGDLVPNTVLMHDDGAGGDERAGDGVWSATAMLAPGTRVSYVYTNSGAPGRWEGLDVPHLRSVVVPGSARSRPVYLPIETFGRVYMQADDWHTDATGYDLIAAAVAASVGAVTR